MEARLSKAFDVKFAKLQKVMEKMADKRDESPKTPAAKKRPAATVTSDYDTRNKALRPRYNPDTVPALNNFNDYEDSQTYRDSGVSRNARSQQQLENSVTPVAAEHAHGPQADVNIRPTLPLPQNSARNLPTSDKNTEMNRWLLENSAGLQPSFSSRSLPMSARDFSDDQALDQRVHSILANAASTVSRSNVRKESSPLNMFSGEMTLNVHR